MVGISSPANTAAARQNGLKGGRPRITPEKRAAKLEFRELCKAETPACLAKLIDLRDHGETLAIQHMATCTLLAYAYGRPAQSLNWCYRTGYNKPEYWC